MTRSYTTVTAERDSARAGRELGAQAREAFDGAPDALIVFASARHDYHALLGALAEAAGTDIIAGSSSAGEFTQSTSAEGAVSVLALRSPDLRFAVGVGTKVGQDPASAAREIATSFQGDRAAMPHRAALVMTDALAGYSDTLVEELTLATGGNYQFFGGGAGDDARFRETFIFAGTRALTNAAVGLEILSRRPLGIGVSHGWEPAGARLRVTETDGMRLVSLNGVPAVEAFEDHAREMGVGFDRSDPLPFFLHNILGIEVEGRYRLRVPLSVEPDGSVACAASVPPSAIVRIMKTSQASAVLAAEQATRAALAALGDGTPAAALVFDCVATRKRLGSAFDNELQACAQLLQPAPFVGCNTYGQVARAEGQFGGFHNCTAVVCVVPD